MVRSKGTRTRGKLAVRLSAVIAVAAFLASVVAVALVVQVLGSGLAPQGRTLLGKAWALGLVVALLGGLVVGLVAWVQGSQIGSRIVDLGLGVAKMGRGSAEVRIRYTGNDEIAALGRALQYLAGELAVMAREAEAGGGVLASGDPMVRELRDRALPERIEPVEGYEVDAAVGAGSRGGLDYYDVVRRQDSTVLVLVSPEGAGTVPALAVRMARDQIVRALEANATPRRALAHANKVLHRDLPRGGCAKAALLELRSDGAKLYQAGYRAPALQCARGEIEQVTAEGLAVGLDEGPVFEKALRPTSIDVTPGVRIVLVNEAGVRLDELQDLVRQHAPKHTAAFMNMVLGQLEGMAGEGGLREDVVLLTAKRAQA